MKVVRGKQLVELDDGEFERRRTAASRVVVDLGTGDGRAAYRLAAAEPGWLVVGVDPAWARLVPTSVRAARKPARGGVANLLLVAGTAERPPPQLHGVAAEVLVLMPWGSLLRGVVEGRADVCGGLRRVAAPGAALEVTVGTSIWREPVPREVRDLPELTPTYVDRVLRDRLATAGWRVTGFSWRSSADLATTPTGSGALSSSWARRLGSGTPETVAHLSAVAVTPTTGDAPEPR